MADLQHLHGQEKSPILLLCKQVQEYCYHTLCSCITIGQFQEPGLAMNLIETIPNHLKNAWNEWALEGMILISMASQIVLLLLGKRRKHNPRTRIRIALWCAYLLAYAVPSGALGIIWQTSSELKSLWASFLLLHVGGPDTITAYSLEDNELWLRHVAQISFQLGLAAYILLLSLPGSYLLLLSLLVYIAGFIKCFERIYALRLANTEHLLDSMLGSPDPGPNYPKIVGEYRLRKRQGYDVDVLEQPLPATNTHAYPEGRDHVISERYDVEAGEVQEEHETYHAYLERRSHAISEAYTLFQTFKRIFVDLILTFEDTDKSNSYFKDLNSIEAFSVVEIELGFAYDMLYTKAKVVYTFVGLVIHFIRVLIVIGVLVGFCFLCDIDDYRFLDIVITYLLFAKTFVMEMFEVITMLRSDWADVWLIQHNHSRNFLRIPFLKQPAKQQWSNSIAQLDLLSVALEEKPASHLTIQKYLGIDKQRVKHRYKTYTKVSDDLKDLIYKQLKNFMCSNTDPKELCSHKGSFSLRKNKRDDLLWSITDVSFDQSIILWHIATTLCFYSEELDNQDQVDIGICRLESKHISDYMLHLLVSCPVMLPKASGMIEYRNTCAEATRYFKEYGPITKKVEACRKLLEVYSPEVSPSITKGDRCKSALFDGCRLVFTLKNMEKACMWRVMSQVWIEILAYAATHCRGFQHAQHLRKGGEFLTHVWLLMAHLGITEQFQVSQGHARARLVST